jgi:hypothetical protein
MAKTNYWISKSEKDSNIFSKLVKRHFAHLKKANLLLTYRDGEKHDKEGNLILAEARKISSKERDLFGFDFEICMDADQWNKSNMADKYRVAYHELCHCGVEMEEGTNEVVFDENNRLKTYMIKHDIFLTSFKNEIEIFGFDGADKDVAEFMTEMMGDKEKIKKNKKKFLGELGIEIYKESAAAEVIKKKKKKKPILDDDEDFDIDEEPAPAKKKKKKLKDQASSVRMSTAKTEKKKKRPVDDDEDED